METKKNNNSNPETYRKMFFIFGLLISLSVLFFAFNFETKKIKTYC